MRYTAAVLLLLFSANASASEPGSHLDCTDIEYLEPGLTCSRYSTWTPEGGCNPSNPSGCVGWSGIVNPLDNEGRIFRMHQYQKGVQFCGAEPMLYTAIQRFDQGAWIDVARFEDRCVAANEQDEMAITGHSMFFDPPRGRLLVWIVSITPGQPNDHWVVEIGGFTTLYEIMQSYEAPANLSFRVPVMPEGLESVDWFDTYYGDLATVGDWSQAQPLQCGYPASAPSDGDYLTVDDPLPNPAPGHGRYYVTAVSFQGLRRFGRSSVNGRLSGRNPGMLSDCAR